MKNRVIQKALNNLYNEGKITIKEKTRISGLSIEEALEIEFIRPEVVNVAKSMGAKNFVLKPIKKDKASSFNNVNKKTSYDGSIIEKDKKEAKNKSGCMIALVVVIIALFVIGGTFELSSPAKSVMGIIFFPAVAMLIVGMFYDK